MKAKEEMTVRSLDRAIQVMFDRVSQYGIDTVWDRYVKMHPQCKFGDLGLCCRICLQGPCRINPSGKEPRYGICGADADIIIARNLARAVSAGTAGHSGHAKHLAHTLLKVSEGKTKDYTIKDPTKLRTVAQRIGVVLNHRSEQELAKEVALQALGDFSEREEGVLWVTSIVNEERLRLFQKLELLPKGIDHEVSEIMHRTLYGTDGDALNLLMGAMRCALADLAGCYMATDLADILFGTPVPIETSSNLGVLKRDWVNIAVHGHNPILSEIIVQKAKELENEAKAVGAQGINIVGICCTGNELLSRHGIPACTHSVSQEMALLTGAVDAIVVDYQCIMPALAGIAQCTGSKLITTMSICKIQGAYHVSFSEELAGNKAEEIIGLALDTFKKRNTNGKGVFIPEITTRVVAGFSVEGIVDILKRVNSEAPLKPLVDAIVNGQIRGVCLFAGCNNVKVPQDRNFVSIARDLLKNNILILATGCGAGALMRHGFMDPMNVDELCGESLKKVLKILGEAYGFKHPLPAVLHLGSCVDNSRAIALLVSLAKYLNLDTDKMPVVASAPEAVSEKAISIGLYAVAMGVPTHVGVKLPIEGSPAIGRILTEGLKEITGGYFIYELDPVLSSQKLLKAIDERRRQLGL